jgi:hypothetical protein
MKHQCDNCGKEVKRHVFCDKQCNIKYFNRMRVDTLGVKDDTLSIKKIPNVSEITLNVSEEPVINRSYKHQVLNCKKHHGSSNCGCTE